MSLWAVLWSYQRSSEGTEALILLRVSPVSGSITVPLNNGQAVTEPEWISNLMQTTPLSDYMIRIYMNDTAVVFSLFEAVIVIHFKN